MKKTHTSKLNVTGLDIVEIEEAHCKHVATLSTDGWDYVSSFPVDWLLHEDGLSVKYIVSTFVRDRT